jgi:hypothetical protein
MTVSLFCVQPARTTFNRQISRPGAVVTVVPPRPAVETVEVVVSQFMRDMSMTKHARRIDA